MTNLITGLVLITTALVTNTVETTDQCESCKASKGYVDRGFYVAQSHLCRPTVRQVRTTVEEVTTCVVASGKTNTFRSSELRHEWTETFRLGWVSAGITTNFPMDASWTNWVQVLDEPQNWVFGIPTNGTIWPATNGTITKLRARLLEILMTNK